MKGSDIDQYMRKYVRVALLGLAASAVATNFAGFFTAENAAGMVHAICDGLFVAAVLLLGGGGLGYASNQGIFDVLRYGTSLAINVMRPGKFVKKYGSYVDYKEHRKSKKIEWVHIVLVGCGYLVAAFIALGVYYLLQ